MKKASDHVPRSSIQIAQSETRVFGYGLQNRVYRSGGDANAESISVPTTISS